MLVIWGNNRFYGTRGIPSPGIAGVDNSILTSPYLSSHLGHAYKIQSYFVTLRHLIQVISNLHGHIIIILHILVFILFLQKIKSMLHFFFFSDDISLRNIDTRPLLLFRQIKMAPQFLFNVKWTLKMELSFVKLCFKKFLVIVKYKTYRSVLRPSVMYSPERPWLLAGRELSAVLIAPPQYGPVVLSASVPTV